MYHGIIVVYLYSKIIANVKYIKTIYYIAL